MATIVFFISNLQGEFNGSLKLAKTLKSLGHKVFYLGVLDSKEKVSKYGFTFLPILENYFPKGFYQQEDNNNLNLSGLRLLIEQRKNMKLMKSLIDSLYKGENREIHNVLKEIHPDLLLIGTASPNDASIITLIAYECKISTIYLTDTLISLPPPKNLIQQEKNIKSADNSGSSVLSNKYQFQHWRQAIQNKFPWLIKRGFYEDFIRKFARSRKIPLELLDFSQHLPLKLPHLFLFPEELELPNYSREGCYYAEASIDLQREEPSFDWSKLNKDKALIYCSLGTTGETFQTLSKNKVQNFFQNLIDAISFKKEYQLVVSVSDHINVKDFHSVPENAIIINRAPQLALLEKASLAIIQGGAHTVKECIFFGVPMIVFPVIADQPANAERIKYHGLGVVGDIKNTSVTLIIDLVEKIENDFLFKPRLEAWKNKFREIENSGKATKFILEVLEENKRI
ncbi:MAG: nucleotide disphospho-sugar-binding domain-containing protein [Nostoc sp.]|uniref:nucleotide disphospho-sugar-binding domain-containing protein n=1 Tax=Nostoc sp. TaxID=1180 RepID=UPI002FFA20B8